MSLVSIGPIVIGELEHGNPTYSWGAGADSSPFAIGGLLTWDHMKQLRAFVDNPGAKKTIRGAHGVLAHIVFSGALFSDLSGAYVLSSFSSDPTKAHTMSDQTAPFSLSGTYLGDVA